MLTAQLLTLAPALTLAIVVIGLACYFFGRRKPADQSEAKTEGHETLRAQTVMRELEEISQGLRRSLATHHASVLQFKARIESLRTSRTGDLCDKLVAEAEKLLEPTNALSSQLAAAYEDIRQHTQHLLSFAEVRTDGLTGLSNRRGMEELLNTLLAMKARYDHGFSIAIVDIDDFNAINDAQGNEGGDQVLRDFAELLKRTIRETDSVSRFGEDEFVAILPETDLPGGCVFCERLRKAAGKELSIKISCGVATVSDGDTVKTIISRADTALYSAKSAGQDCVFRHNGRHIEESRQTPPSTATIPQTSNPASGSLAQTPVQA